jgi:Tfp pilus assembly protein PilN
MSLVEFVVVASAMIIALATVVGIPAVAVIILRLIRMKEREMTGGELPERLIAFENRVRQLEETLGSLDRDVRLQIGIAQSAPPAREQLEDPLRDADETR